jgi:hypothetical protein
MHSALAVGLICIFGYASDGSGWLRLVGRTQPLDRVWVGVAAQLFGGMSYQDFFTFAACSPFGPLTTSNDT